MNSRREELVRGRKGEEEQKEEKRWKERLLVHYVCA